MPDDFRYVLRSAVRSPGSTALIVCTLGLAIGGATTLFSFVSGILLRGLPYSAPGTLVAITRSHELQGFRGLEVPGTQLRTWREASRTLSPVTGAEYEGVHIAGEPMPERVTGARVLPELLPLLGLEPLLGRSFHPEEFEPGGEAVAILGHRFWQRRYGGDQDVIGRTVRIDGEPYLVMGVLEPGGELPVRRADVLMPLRANWVERGRDSPGFFRVFARLAPGATLDQASEEIAALVRRDEEEHPTPVRGWGAEIVPLARAIVGEVRPALLALLGAVGLLLWIGCANVAHLLLVRGAERERDWAIRSALGADRRRIVRLLLTESVALALLAGALGLLLARAGLEVLIALGPPDLPRLENVVIDGRVAAFSFVVSVAAGALASLFPALVVDRAGLADCLQSAGRGAAPSRPRHRVREGLLFSEIALALTLSIGAGWMIESLARLLSIDPGFEPPGALSLRISLPEHRYDSPVERKAILEEVLRTVETLPEVSSIAASSWTPLSGSWGKAQASVEAVSGAVEERARWALVTSVTPDYFRTLGIPLLAGRDFGAEDRPGAPAAVIVNRTLAEHAWPGADALGKRIKFGAPGSDAPWFTVVGVAGDARLVGLATAPEETMFLPLLQWERTPSRLELLARTATEPSSIAPALRELVWRLDEEIPIADVRPLDEILAGNVARPRFNLMILGLFASMAVGLAAAGVYGVAASAVSHRSREIAVRMALGADRRSLMRLVLGRTMIPVLLGIMAGLAFTFAAARLVAGLLFEVSATHPGSFLPASLLLAGIALGASLGPAWRAARLDPMIVLRAE